MGSFDRSSLGVRSYLPGGLVRAAGGLGDGNGDVGGRGGGMGQSSMEG